MSALQSIRCRFRLLLVVAGALVSLSCTPEESRDVETNDAAQPPESSVVSGTLMKRDRRALPPSVIAEIKLIDVSKADAPSVDIAVQRIENPGQLPIAFELEYDPRQIDERHSYAVRAKLMVGDQLLYTTDTHYPVLTRGAGREAELMLVPVAR